MTRSCHPGRCAAGNSGPRLARSPPRALDFGGFLLMSSAPASRPSADPSTALVLDLAEVGAHALTLAGGKAVGPNSHGAVVAREYGIPAVVGVPHATSRITSGRRITVDGGRGTVTETE